MLPTPYSIELIPTLDVMQAVRALIDFPGLILFDSARTDPTLGRYSFLSADPVVQIQLQTPQYGSDPFARLRAASAGFSLANDHALPPFQGGVAGMLGYELAGCFERVATAPHDEFQIPVLSAGIYDWVIAWDHLTQKSWIIATGFPEIDPQRRKARAERRIESIQSTLSRSPAALGPVVSSKILAPNALVTQFPLEDYRDITSSLSIDEYLRRVQRVVDYIHAGDIFQANFTQRLITRSAQSPLDLYERLRSRNPAPFAGLYVMDDAALLSASPERFLRVDDGIVQTRPIKGTRRRPRPQPEADLFVKDELRESQKDRSENVMIVDLLRNDLSRVCRPGTLRVPRLCDVETFETVQHLVSEVQGQLESQVTPWDLLAATWPGGSISGAPKIRAMEIIAELEPTVRGPYTGSLFYCGFNGQMDSNLLIRTFVDRWGWLQLGVGGGIVADSDPATEYEESLHKAAGMLAALR